MTEISFTSVLPPLVILAVGYLTRHIILSLGCGVVVAAFIACGGDPLTSLAFVGSKLYKTLELEVVLNPATFWQSWNAFIAFFLLSLGVLIVLIHHSGGAYAYERFIRKHFKQRKHVEASSLALSSCLVFDDYFSSLTVGSVMHPITDAYRIPRAKLAFLVDTMAAPLTVLCPVSSWVAAIVGFLRDSGIRQPGEAGALVEASPFYAYLNILPFMLYSFVVIMGAWFIVLKGLSFGAMAEHEARARKTGHCGGRDGGNLKTRVQNPDLRDFFIPVGVLVVAIFAGILHSGHSVLFGGHNALADALREAAAARGLFVGGFFTMLFATFYYLLRGRLGWREFPALAWEGMRLMASAIVVLALAWTLGGMLRNDLGTGQYLASVLTNAVPSQLLPLMFFMVSVLTAFTIGSAWGTAAVMFPIAVQFMVELQGGTLPLSVGDLPLLFPTLAAVLSGGIAGNHISPISDTTIMSATSTAMPHTDHVETQFGYVWPLIATSACGFIALGYGLVWGPGWAWMIAVPATLAAAAVSLWALQQRHAPRVATAHQPKKI